MIELILPPRVSFSEAFVDDLKKVPHSGEEDLLLRSTPSRRREFITARSCARDALGELGFSPQPILSGRFGEPLWPTGAVGSITHCMGYRAAIAGLAKDFDTLGVDAEPHRALPNGVLARVLEGNVEYRLLAWVADHYPLINWDRLMFSAKESVYKAWYPLTGRWLDFRDVRLSINPESNTFRAGLLTDGTRRDGQTPLGELGGWFLVERDLIITVVALPNSSAT